MLVRAVVGFGLLAAFIVAGAWINDRRRHGQPWVRGLARRAHWTVGVLAAGAIALLVVGAVTYLLQ
jgi:hypothetical protein